MKQMRLFNSRLIAAMLSVISFNSAIASDASLTAIGDLDRLAIGQAGFCGARAELTSSEWQKIVMKGDEQLWFFAKSTYRTPNRTYNCSIERTFIPASGKAYILRVSHEPKNCKVELFRVVNGSDPVRENLLQPALKSCALE